MIIEEFIYPITLSNQKGMRISFDFVMGVCEQMEPNTLRQ
jgi:hypothetical protein